MRSLIASARTWLRGIVRGGTADVMKYPVGKMGRQTARFLRTIGPSLTSSELGWIITLGEREGTLTQLRARLSEVHLGMAAIDRDASAMKTRIDALFSEPGGLLARTLAPLRSQTPAETQRRIGSALAVAERLVTEAGSVLDTAETLAASKARLSALEARYRDALPATVDKMLSGARVTDRMQATTTRESATRLLARVNEMERSLERQHVLYEGLLGELERSARACGIDLEELRRKSRGLEQYTRELETKVNEASDSRRSAAFKKTRRTARQHHKRLEADDRFTSSDERVEGMPSHAALREWKALHVMKPLVAIQESAE